MKFKKSRGPFQPNLAQAFLGEGDSILFKWKTAPLSKRENKSNF